MNSILRGIRNVFRSPGKTLGIILILGLSMTVALIMLMANQVVGQRIEDVKGSIGNIITVAPQGIRGFEGGGELLKEKDVTPISSLEHVTLVSSTLQARPSSTSLSSAIDPGSFGERFGPRRIEGGSGGFGGTFTAFVSLNVTGTDQVGSLPSSGFLSTASNLTDGRYFNAEDANVRVAILGKDLAEKNDLQVDSTFELEDKKFKVVGIFDTGTLFSNNALYLPLGTTQTLFDLAENVSEVTVTADNISNVESVIAKIKGLLGDKVDVSSEQERFSQALSPLESIAKTTQVAAIGSLGAGVIIIFFAMFITVRQRIKEIGILKAIGASNRHLVTQFVAETMTISLFATLLSAGISFLAGNSIVNSLVQQSSTSGPGSGLGQAVGQFFLGNVDSLQVFDLKTLGYALLIAVGIGILGSIGPALIASRLKPAEVIRLE